MLHASVAYFLILNYWVAEILQFVTMASSSKHAVLSVLKIQTVVMKLTVLVVCLGFVYLQFLSVDALSARCRYFDWSMAWSCWLSSVTVFQKEFVRGDVL